MRYLLFILMMGAIPRAFADPMLTVWNCSLEAGLYGDARYFLRYGHDSWKGRGQLICESDGKTEQRDVEISFDSTNLGFGVNSSSRIMLHLSLATSTPPEEFHIATAVASDEAEADLVWQGTDAGVSIEATITAESIPGIKSSLRRGILYIR